MSPLIEVAPSELLGRGVFSRRDAVRSERSGPRPSCFLPRCGDIEISVDRLCLASEDVFVRLGEDRATERRTTFYGWAVITAAQAGSNGRQVNATPICDVNPFHADIVLPDSAAEDRDCQKLHAKQLADEAIWRPRSPESSISQNLVVREEPSVKT